MVVEYLLSETAFYFKTSEVPGQRSRYDNVGLNALSGLSRTYWVGDR
jgi:hypothetical protein